MLDPPINSQNEFLALNWIKCFISIIKIGTFSKVHVGGQLLPAMTYMLLNSQTIQTAK